MSEANSLLESLREFGRFTLSDKSGDILTLSVAVEGGGRQLRYADRIEEVRLSEHGEWRRNHLRAIEACLGKKPYYSHIFSSISDIYLDKNIVLLKDFNMAIFGKLYSFILGDLKETDFLSFPTTPLIRERGEEIAGKIKPEISSLEALSILGKESVLGFFCL